MCHRRTRRGGGGAGGGSVPPPPPQKKKKKKKKIANVKIWAEFGYNSDKWIFGGPSTSEVYRAGVDFAIWAKYAKNVCAPPPPPPNWTGPVYTPMVCVMLAPVFKLSLTLNAFFEIMNLFCLKWR